jgi:hypothetical protein
VKTGKKTHNMGTGSQRDARPGRARHFYYVRNLTYRSTLVPRARSSKKPAFGTGQLFVLLGLRPRKITRKSGGPHAGSQYLHAQAQLYFDIARLLTDPKAAKAAMATAAQYLEQAEEMKRAERASSERATG